MRITLAEDCHPRAHIRLPNGLLLPPGFGMLATKWLPAGSDTPTNTIGMVRVSRRSAAAAGVELPTRISGRNATSSLAYTCGAWCSASLGPAERHTLERHPVHHKANKFGPRLQSAKARHGESAPNEKQVLRWQTFAFPQGPLDARAAHFVRHAVLAGMISSRPDTGVRWASGRVL
jgi:hypothetical protein